MAAKKNNNQQYNRKDFKYYTKTFGNFSLWNGGILVFPLCLLGILGSMPSLKI
jgi:hypothetical protein